MADIKETFKSKVVPVMDKVRDELQSRQADELRGHSFSLHGLLAGAAGPDGGMTALAVHDDTLRHAGKWNSKTVEDYVEMVKAELRRRHISVTPEMERMMTDKMIKDRIPRSSVEYVLRKAAGHFLFGIPNEMHKSPLQAEIEARAKQAYSPTRTEKAVAWGLGTGVDILATGGFGGGWKGTAAFFGTDLALNAVTDGDGQRTPASGSAEKPQGTAADNEEQYVPSVIAPEYREEYLKEKERQEEAGEEEKNNHTQTMASAPHETSASSGSGHEQPVGQTKRTNVSGWSGLLQSFGLDGFSDIGRNLGYVLAMLPDVLVGLFTGKTKSLNMDNSLMPLASIMAGMFVRNPILKMLLIGTGGANLINKAGHEVLERKRDEGVNASVTRPQYKAYADEPLNPRIANPVLQGHCLIAHIDKVPCTIQLPDNVAEACQAGALPVNTLANAILAKNDRMRQMASERYEQNRQETITITRGIQ